MKRFCLALIALVALALSADAGQRFQRFQKVRKVEKIIVKEEKIVFQQQQFFVPATAIVLPPVQTFTFVPGQAFIVPSGQPIQFQKSCK